MNSAYRLRSGFFFFLFCMMYIVIGVHLYIVQVVHNDFYSNLGKQQYTIVLHINPTRASIYDRHGNYLAINKDCIAGFILPKHMQDRPAVEAFLAQHFPAALERFRKQNDTHFMYIKRKLSQDEIALLENSGIDDLKLLNEPHRFYPNEYAGTLVGLTDIDNNGQFGAEFLFNKQLAGTPSTVFLERDARSGHFYFKKETKVQGDEGKPVTLTIDSDLQFLVHEELQDTINKFDARDGGAALIMDPDTGEILACASYPTFNPNSTTLLNVEHTKNKVITDCHELGSVMKAFVALGLLEDKLIEPEEEIDCENTRTSYVNGVRVNTWKGHGVLPFSQVIQTSNNIGIVKAAQRLGPDLYDHYRKVGFGQKTGINWPGEQSGFVNHPKNWSKLSLTSLSYGYEITGSLLQLATAFSVIANGGYLVRPKLIQDDESPMRTQIYSPDAIEQMQSILEKTVTHGTAFRARLNGYHVMGKTGTSNMVINGKYDPDHNTYSFAGIVKRDGYTRVIATFIKNAARKNLYASQVAVPLFERIAQALLIHDKVL